jgi:hypothetical protein
VLAAAAYVLAVAWVAHAAIPHVYWDTDASAPLVLAERLRGHGTVFIPHFASWTVLWLMLATRHLPGHREVWEGAGYPFAVATAGLLGWATARVAGAWAGVTATAVALVAGPFALRSRLTFAFHSLPPFGAAVLGAYLVLIARPRPRSESIALAVLVGLIAGLTAASDPLTWLAGVAPFAIAAAWLALATRRRAVATAAAIALGSAVTAAVAADLLMHELDYRLVGLDLQPAALSSLAANTRHLGRMIALLSGANYALPGGYPREPIRFIVAILGLVGVTTVLVVAWRELRRRTDALASAYACYWAASVLLLGLSFVVTTNASALGAGSMNYLLSFALAVGAGVGMLAVSHRAQVVAAVAICLVAGINAVGVAQGRADTGLSAIAMHKSEVVHVLESNGVTRGYAGYWDAQNLTWQSRLKVRVAPVVPCDQTLCGLKYFVIDSWYRPQAGPSFLIVDPQNGPVSIPPPFTRTASASYRFGQVRLFLFRYDIARRFHAARV